MAFIRNLIRRILALKWGILGLILFAVLYLMFQSPGDKTKKQAVVRKKEEPMILTNPLLKDFEDGELRFRLIADQAEIYEKSESIFLTKPQAKLFDEGEPDKVTFLKSEKGEIKNKQDLLFLRGSVYVEFHDGQRLFTEELIVDNKKKLIYNSVAVKAVSDKDVINAASMRYQMKRKILRLKQPKALIAF